MGADLDELDYGILQLLQENARDRTPVDMADVLPVSDTTVRNRIESLEEEGVLERYVPVIDYEKAGFPIRIKFSCTASTDERAEVVEDVLELPHVVAVDEMLSARENVRVLAVATTSEEVHEIASRLDELPLTIERETLLRRSHLRPFSDFGDEVPSSE